MKKLRFIFTFILILGLLALIPKAPVSAQEDRTLTVDRVVQISDYDIVIEFSEPIAFNLHDSSSRGPWVSLRIVNAGMVIQFDSGMVDIGNALQWMGSLAFTDETHDKLIFSIEPSTFGVKNINDITSFKGELAKFRAGNQVHFVIEEICFRQDIPFSNGCLDNITTADGEVYLWGNRHSPGTYDAVSLPIEVDYTYQVDMTKLESIAAAANTDENILTVIKAGEDPGTDLNKPSNEPGSTNLWLWIGGGALFAVAEAVILIAVFRKAGKKE